jgi:hypothetical protein
MPVCMDHENFTGIQYYARSAPFCHILSHMAGYFTGRHWQYNSEDIKCVIIPDGVSCFILEPLAGEHPKASISKVSPVVWSSNFQACIISMVVLQPILKLKYR